MARLADPSTRTFEARLGPSGGAKGYTGITGLPTTGTVWYVNGQMAPEIYLRRGLTYAFRIEGGNDPYSPGTADTSLQLHRVERDFCSFHVLNLAMTAE